MKETKVTQLKSVDLESIEQLNKLFDEGTVWDDEQGNKFLENHDNALFIAYIGNTIVGFLTAYRLQRLDKRKAEALLYEVGVDERFRQLGVGKSLLAAVKTWAKEVGADEVWVLTNKSNAAAVALYKSMGGATESDDEQMYVIKI